MIINIRGTHGSGKSTVVRRLIQQFVHEVQSGTPPVGRKLRGEPKPRGYKVQVPFLQLPVYVVGPYTTACGGCDAIQPYSLIWPTVTEYAQQGHVLFEGALVSSSYGNIGRDSECYGDEFLFAFMDTPLKICLERIVRRREAKGDTRPLDPRNTEHKYRSIQTSLGKIRDQFRRHVVMLDHRRPLCQVLTEYLKAERKRPH